MTSVTTGTVLLSDGTRPPDEAPQQRRAAVAHVLSTPVSWHAPPSTRCSQGVPAGDELHRPASGGTRTCTLDLLQCKHVQMASGRGYPPLSHCRTRPARFDEHDTFQGVSSGRARQSDGLRVGSRYRRYTARSNRGASDGCEKTSRGTVFSFSFILFFGVVLSLLPAVIGSGTFKAIFLFHGQVLTLCHDEPVVVTQGKVENIQLPMVCREPHEEQTCCGKPHVEPQVITTGLGTLKACTHDPQIFYRCPSIHDPGCFCLNDCQPYYSRGVQFPPECQDVVFALEDTWGSFNISINHAPGAEGQSVPFDDPIVTLSYNLMYKLTVTYGELDLLGTLSGCDWKPIDKANMDDLDRLLVKSVCDVDLQSLPKDWGSTEKVPYHIRFTKYEEDDSVHKMSLEFSGLWTCIDRLIRLITYKPKWNMNTNRIRSPVYDHASAKFPSELLVIEVSQMIDSNYTRAKIATGRLQQQRTPWTFAGNNSIIVHIHDQNDPPTITHPSSTYIPPIECNDPTSELPECNFGQYFAYEGTSAIVQIKGVKVADVDMHESCTSLSNQECKLMDIAVRVHKGTVSLNTRSNLYGIVETRSGSGFTSRLSDLNTAIQKLDYAVEKDNLLGRPQSTVIGYNTQVPGNVEFVTVTASDQGFSGRFGIKEESSIKIDLVIVAVNDGPVVQSSVSEFTPTEDILGPLKGITISDRDLEEKVQSTLASRSWTGKASNSLYLNQMRVHLSVTYGVIKMSYVRNLNLIFTDSTQYMTISPMRFGHDVCLVSTYKDQTKLLSKHWQSMGNPGSIPSYQSICSYNNVGGLTCPTGSEQGCTCFEDGRCDSDNGKIVLHLNRSRGISSFIQTMTHLLDLTNRTCGGMPVYPSPNNFTIGRPCENDKICTEMPKCTPGVTCHCCANISHICSSNDDCSHFDAGSFCGCVSGGNGLCGPFWLKANGPSGPFTTDLISPGGEKPELDGHPCTYTGEGSETCKSAAFASEGTNLAKLVNVLTLSSLGTNDAQIFGPIIDINRALDSLNYLTISNYNRFYRPPPEQRDPFTFDMEADSLDTLKVEAYDFGNSGGGPRDPKSHVLNLNIRVAAVNDQPKATGPAKVKAYEDIPFHFTDLPDFAFSGEGTSRENPIRGPRLAIADPDYKDYLFEFRQFTVNISCLHGRLFLNEGFLKSERTDSENPNRPEQYQIGMAQEDEDTTWRPGIVFKIWEKPDPNLPADAEAAAGQDLKGLINVEHDGQGTQFRGTRYIKYGDGCQFKPQCADGAAGESDDTAYGFFETQWYGVVYPLAGQTTGKGGSSHSCGLCADVVGNRFVSFQGTFEDINKALELVTYLPDPHFNTRYSLTEYLTLSVNDNGAIGNDYTQNTGLSHVLRVEIVVESINDRPLIGRLVSRMRPINYWNGGVKPDKMVADDALLAINKTLDDGCFAVAPSSTEYKERCHTKVREYIDVDEDTLFYISPSTLWIHDADSEEAKRMPSSRRWCCEEAGEMGCTCGKSCRCGAKLCTCSAPAVCSNAANPGELLVSFEVQHGLLSFYPPPGRTMFPTADLMFIRNLTSKDVTEGGFDEPCPNQLTCMRNVSRLQMRASLSTLQAGLSQMFLTYTPKPNFFGKDLLSIYVSDQGYTDECYNATLGKREQLSIRVVGVNDAPVVRTNDKVLLYGRGQQCFFNFQDYKNSQPIGLNPDCVKLPNLTKVPSPDVGPSWSLEDVDMDASAYGNITLLLTNGLDPGHANSGSFTLKEIPPFSDAWYSEYRNSDGLLTLEIAGKIPDVNRILQQLAYNADPSYQGYAPFMIRALDMFNSGECSGNHKCGANEAACMDPGEAGHHESPLNGITSKVVDMTIGAKATCIATVEMYNGDKQKACEECVKQPVIDGVGCGWCPSACPDLGGKCMIANAGGGPRFETCSPLISLQVGSPVGWNQCTPPASMLPLIAGSVGGTFFFLLVVAYFFQTWVRRRHGSIPAYLRRKSYAFRSTAQQFRLLPPEGAHYFQFCCLVVLEVVLQIIIWRTSSMVGNEPLCDYTQEWFLDRSASLHLKLDNCHVDFVPALEQPSPKNELKGIMLKLAITTHSDVVVTASFCGRDATLQVDNRKPGTRRYLNYWCRLQVLIPLDGFVVPQITVEAKGDNVTTVESGPTAITPTFKLDFGPNDFVLKGKSMVARLHKISAKNFKFTVGAGRLTLIDMRTESAEFESTTADMLVTSSKRSSVRFWQKEADKVCLSAPKGSLYVEDACRKVCQLRDASGTLIDVTSNEASRRRSWPKQKRGTDSPEIATESEIKRRVLGANTTNVFELTVTDPVGGAQGICNGTGCVPFVCTGLPNVDKEWTCFPYDAVAEALKEPCPAGSDFAFKKDVPQVPGCTDLEFCRSSSSSQCLCKPGCDMQGLDPPGTCDVGGRCCQIFCQGYSKADMFPDENVPRCPQTAEQPWCNGTLDQQVRFLSQKGQISFQVGHCSDDSPGECSVMGNRTMPVVMMHSYKGSQPSASIQTGVDLREADKVTLDKKFHPSGASRPKEEWFSFRLTGPGAPETSYGEFIWINSVRHLILEPWLMGVLSFGLLAPKRALTTANLNPGFCPHWTDYKKPEFTNRIKVIYRIVRDAVQKYPPGQKEKTLPVGTMIAFKPVSGKPIWFGVDSKSNQPILGYVVPEDHPLLVLLLGLGLAIPFVTATAVSLYLVNKYLTFLHEYRRTRILQEQTMRQLHLIMAGRGPDPEGELIEKEYIDEMIARTSFWYIFEEFISNAEESRTYLQQVGITFIEFLFGISAAVLPWYLNFQVASVYSAMRCEFRSDICKCRTEVVGVLHFTVVVSTFLDIYFYVLLVDLGLHYLEVSYNVFRKIWRYVFGIIFSMVLFLSLLGVVVSVLFNVLGVMLKPQEAAPRVIPIFGTASVMVLLSIKIHKFQARVERAITKNVTLYKSKVADIVPKEVLDAIMGKNIKRVLNEHWLSITGAVMSVLIYGLCMGCIFSFLFLAFSAFTDDPPDNNAALINCAILLATVVASYFVCVADGDESEMGDRVEMMNDKIMESLQKTLDMIVAQIVTAKDMVKRMRKQMDMDDDIAEDDSTSADSSDDISTSSSSGTITPRKNTK